MRQSDVMLITQIGNHRQTVMRISFVGVESNSVGEPRFGVVIFVLMAQCAADHHLDARRIGVVCEHCAQMLLGSHVIRLRIGEIDRMLQEQQIGRSLQQRLVNAFACCVNVATLVFSIAQAVQGGA